jgi:ABC-2 type transport system permease protein
MASCTLNFFRPIRHTAVFFYAEIKRLIAYRVQFWCELVLSSLIELLVAFTVWHAVFSGRAEDIIGGYTYPAMVLYVTVAVFFGQATRGTGVGTLAWEIYNGTLTKFLIYPLSVYSYKFGTFLPRAVFALAQLGLALAIIYASGFWPEGVTLTFANLSLALAALLIACLLYFLMLFCLECGAFWADNVWALSVMLQWSVLLLSGRWIPLDLFPPALAQLLDYSPFPYLAFFPIKLLLGDLSSASTLKGFIVLGTWLVIVGLFSRFIFAKGLRQYTGVGI